MGQPTVFVDLQAGPVTVASVAQVATAFGTERVDALVAGDIEVDLVIVDTVAKALRVTKETERAVILIAYTRTGDRAGAEAFASRHERVRAAHLILGTDEMRFAPFLLKLIKSLADPKEIPDAHPAS